MYVPESEDKKENSDKKKEGETGKNFEETLQSAPDEPTERAPFVGILKKPAQEPTDSSPFQKRKTTQPSKSTKSQETKDTE